MERTEKFQRTIARFIIKNPLFFFISVLLVWSTHLDGTLGYGLCHDDDTNSNCRWWWWWREYKLPYFIYIEIRLALLLLLPWRHAWPTASSAARCCILYLYTRRRRRRFFFFFFEICVKGDVYIYKRAQHATLIFVNNRCKICCMSSESAAPADSDTSLILSMVYGQSIMCTYIHTKASGGPATVKDGWKSAAALYRSCRLELFFFFFFFFFTQL